MTRILHLSDTHFGTEREPVVRAVLRLADDLQPDLVVLTGDITQRARRSQFTAARRFVQALQRPVLAVPGNHDIPLFNVMARWLNPYGGYRRALGPVLEPVVDIPGLLAIGVNSTRPSRRKNGEVDAGQVERVAQRLRKASADCLRIVLLHHPVRAAVESDQRNLLIGRELAVPAWIDAGVDLILGGHIHLPYVLSALNLTVAKAPGLDTAAADRGHVRDRSAEAGTTQGKNLSLHSDTPRQAWIVQAGTAISRRVRGDISNSVNVIEHSVSQGRHQCVIERWDYMMDLQAFGRVDSQALDWFRPGQ